MYSTKFILNIITRLNFEISSTLYSVYSLSAQQNLDQVSWFFAPQLDLHTVILILITYF